MKLKLYYYNHPVLRAKAKPVTEFNEKLRAFVKDMVDTMETIGMGLAAPQVGKSIALCITTPPVQDSNGQWSYAPLKVYINPKLSDPSPETWVHSEACISLPKIAGDVERPVAITVTAQDLDGNVFTERLVGWPARVLMHENDHLNGVLFIDRVVPKERNKLEAKLKEINKNYNKS